MTITTDEPLDTTVSTSPEPLAAPPGAESPGETDPEAVSAPVDGVSAAEWLGRAFLLGAVLLLGWLGQSLLLAEPPRLLDGAVLLIMAAVGFVVLAAAARQRGSSGLLGRAIERLEALAQESPREAALLAAGLICGLAAFWLATNPALLPWPALLAWGAGFSLFLAGAWGLAHEPGAAVVALRRPILEARWELALLALLALLLRVLWLETVPRNFGGDEGEMGMMARSVLDGSLRDPFMTGWLSHPTLWFFMQALSLRLFGDTIFGLRILSVLIGVATVPVLYLFARPLYGRVVAFAATALLAVYHFHIHYSRLGVNNIVDPLLALIVFAAFFHGYRTRSPFSFALTGVALGLAQHFYMGARLTPLVLLAVLVHQLILDRRRVLELRWHLGMLAIGFLLGFGPLLRYFLLFPENFNARLAIVGIFQSGWFAQRLAEGARPIDLLAEQARGAFGAFTFLPDRSAFYDPRIPLLDRTSSVLLVLGVALAITRWRRPEAALLLAWVVGVSVFGGMLLIGPPLSPRYVTAAPAICVLIALALEQLGVLLRWAFPFDRRQVYSLGATLLLLLAIWNVNFYFRVYTPRNTYGWLNTEVGTELGIYLRDQPDSIFVYFLGPPRMYLGHGSIRFIAAGVPGVDLLDPIDSPDDLPPLPEGRRPIFIFLPERAGELGVVQQRYPAGALRQFDAISEDVIMFLSYEPR